MNVYVLYYALLIDFEGFGDPEILGVTRTLEGAITLGEQFVSPESWIQEKQDQPIWVSRHRTHKDYKTEYYWIEQVGVLE